MKQSLRTQLKFLSIFSAILAVIVGLVGFICARKMHAGELAIMLHSKAQTNQVHADMLHDGIRGDVLYALLNANSDQAVRVSIREGLEEHASLFREALEDNARLELPEHIRQEIAALRPTLDAYLASARHMVDLAFTDVNAATAGLAQFEQDFSELEGPMESLSSKIESEIHSIQNTDAQLYVIAQFSIVGALVLGAVTILALGLRLGRRISQRTDALVQHTQAIARGELRDQPLDGAQDELALIATALNETARSLQTLLKEAEQLTQAAREGRLSVRADASGVQGQYRELCQGMNAMLDGIVAPVNEAREVMAKVARQDLTARIRGEYSGDHALIKESVNTAVTQMQKVMVVSQAAEEIHRNVQTVASATTQMSSAIEEISRQSAEATRVASNAVDVARETDETVRKLGESSAQIDQVVKLITAIAGQTNLLALNATIEAARAGEAGKGFVVVASEVKNLAKETSRATEEISQKISAIQAETHTAVQAIARISEVIGRVNEINTSIAAAVEEQTATTNEISRNIEEVAKGTSQIAEGINNVAGTAQHTASSAQRTDSTARELSGMASSLRGIVEQFRS
jgi:methyl-accepting chemotaxis protein